MGVTTHFLLWCLGLRQAETQTTETERNALASHCRGRKKVVEIGVWHGVTSNVLLGSMSEEGVFYAVDPYPTGRLGISLQQIIAHRECRKHARGRVRWIRETGHASARVAEEEGWGLVDFVFIDGDHSYEGIKADWLAWGGLVSEGGIIGLHDSRSTPKRPIPEAGSVIYTNEVILSDARFEMLEQVDSLTLLRKRS